MIASWYTQFLKTGLSKRHHQSANLHILSICFTHISQQLIKTFEDGKQHFKSYIEYSMMPYKIKVQQFDHSTTLNNAKDRRGLCSQRDDQITQWQINWQRENIYVEIAVFQLVFVESKFGRRKMFVKRLKNTLILGKCKNCSVITFAFARTRWNILVKKRCFCKCVSSFAETKFCSSTSFKLLNGLERRCLYPFQCRLMVTVFL